MTSRRFRVLVLALSIGGAPCATAQTVTDTLTFLVSNQSVQTGNIDRDRDAAIAASYTISRGILANLATLPVPSSSTGFLYRLNPELGTVERATESFGPFFVERALTAGRGQMSIGVTMQQVRFTAIDGLGLRDGSFVTTANRFVDEAEPFDVDRLTLDLNANVTTLYGNVGITDSVEVGVAAPIVSLFLDGSRSNFYRGQMFTQATANASATGLADLLIRTKVTAYRDGGTALAGAVDVRLPTGATEDLLGVGTGSLKLAAIGSIEGHRVATHANLGYALGGLSDEMSYGMAVAFAASPRVSVIGEVIGRWIDGPVGIEPIAQPHPTLRGVETLRLAADYSSANLVSVVPGVKWNISDTWVLAGNVSIPLTNRGLRARFTPFIGVDFASER